MPYIKRISIKQNLKNSLNYATDSKTKKDYMSSALEYIAGRHKVYNIYGQNCAPNAVLAYKEMYLIKERYKKNDGVQGYHYIQSFKPGEVKPEEAHKIGKEFSEKAFAGRQVIISTHIDRQHVHNHFILNSVNAETGKKFNSSNKTLYLARDISDEISKNYNLNIIDNNKKNFINYQSNFINKKSTEKFEKIRRKIDEAIEKASTYKDFKNILEKEGYKTKENKYLTVTPPGYKKAVRTNNLGQMYSKDFIENRIINKNIVDYKKYYNSEVLEGFKKLTRNDKKELIENVTSQIKIINKYGVEQRKDFLILKKYLNENIRKNDIDIMKISEKIKAADNILSDINYYIENSSNSNMQEQILLIKNKLETNGILVSNIENVKEELEIIKETLSSEVDVLVKDNLEQKDELKTINKISDEKDEKNMHQERI